jgi:O-antigen/teichoic acid export membrane protein
VLRIRRAREPEPDLAEFGWVDWDDVDAPDGVDAPDEVDAPAQSTPAKPEGSLSAEQVKEATLKGVRLFSMTRGAAEATSILAAVVLARLVAPSEFGRLAVAIIVSEFAMMMANETIGTPLVQRADVEPEHLEAATLLGLTIGFGLCIVTLFLAPLVTTPLFGERTSDLFRLFAPAFAVAGLQIVPLARLQRALEFRRIGVVEVIGVFVSSMVAIGLAIAGMGATAYVIGVIAGLVAATIGFMGGAHPVLPRWRPRHMRELLRFGLPATAAGFAGVWYRNIDYMILGARLPAVVVGYYYRAFTVGVEYERRLSGIVTRIAFPVYARTEDPERRLALRLRIVRLNAAVVYPMLTVFIALAPSLVPWLFGARWEPAVLPSQILAVAGMASCIRSLTSPSVLAAGRPSALFWFCLVETLLYGGSVLWASSAGLTVVCIVVSAFQVASLVVAYTVLLHSAVGVARGQLLRDVGPALVACVPLLLVTAAVRHGLMAYLPVPVMAVIAATVGGAAYVVAIRALSASAWDDIVLLAGPILKRFRVRPRLGLALAPAPPSQADQT